MTRSTTIRALLLAAMAASFIPAAPMPSALADTQTKQLNVRNAAEVKSVFKLAARDGGRQAIEISCSPASSDWCAKDFVTACDNAKGGMSTDPDGGVTCSLPQHN